MNSPLFVIPDTIRGQSRRYLVKDREGNILFITNLKDENPEETAVRWAMQRGSWLAGLVESSNIPSSINDRRVLLGLNLDKPLYIVLDSYKRRFLVVDDDYNVLFLTDLNDKEPEQTATQAAMQLGGWLRGVVKSI